MAQKKDRSRFTIKFRESDPAHDMTIRILEKQGQRNIAPFLVNAVLHYVQCSETPDMSHMMADNPVPMVDKNAIEEIVWGILRQQGIIEIKESIKNQFWGEEEKQNTTYKDTTQIAHCVNTPNIVDDEIKTMISKSLSAFRKY